MAKRLPLYPDKRLPLEQEEPRDLNGRCKRCTLHKNSRNVCLPAVGEPGGILMVGDWPTKHDDAAGRPFASKRGKYAHKIAKRYYKGPIAFDNALRCLPNKGSTKLPNNAIDKCRGYLTQTLNEVRPERVILSGPRAVAAVFGESVQPLSARRSIGWLWNDGKPIPVFIVLTPGQAISNTFLQRWFESDMKWALTCDLDEQWMPPYDGYCSVIETVGDVEDAIDACYEANGFTYDVETVGRVCDNFFKIISLSVTPYGSDTAWVFTRDQLEKGKFTKPLTKLLGDDELPKTGTNVKYDHESVEYYLGTKVRGTHIDARLVRKLLFSDASGKLSDMAFLIGMGGHKLEADRYLTKAKAAIGKARKTSSKAAFLPGIVEEEIEEACKTDLKPATYAYGLLPDEVLWRYNALDTITTDRVREYVTKRLKKKKHVRRIWRRVVSRATEAVTQVELWGMPIDRQSVVNYDRYLDEQIRITSKTFKRIKAANGQEFNPDSPQQVQELLFQEYGLPVLVKTDSGDPSTAKGVLESIMRLTPGKAKMDKSDLREAQKTVKALLAYRALSKLKGTYAEGMFSHIRDDGRVHPSLNIDGASSGRTSCSDPNLQNIPRGSTPAAQLARACYIAPPGRKIIQLDYSTLEYRIAAMLSGDKVMIDMFKRGADFHMATAQMIARSYFGVDPDDVTKEMRSQSKTFNFALLYGKTDRSLAGDMGCTVDKAAELRASIMGEWSDLDIFLKECIKFTERTGKSLTWWDGANARERSLYRIGNIGEDSDSRGKKITARNGAINSPVQGTASDYCIASLIECVDWLLNSGLDAKLIISVHDSLMFDVADDDVDEVCKTAHDVMLSHNAKDVPLKVDVEVGASWGSLEKYEIAA